MKTLTLAVLLGAAALGAADKKNVLLIAGKPSHPSGEHEHNAGIQLLASGLKQGAADLVDARRSCRRAPRAPSRPHRRAPTDVILTFSFVAALPIAAPAHSSQHDDSEPAPSRERVVI